MTKCRTCHEPVEIADTQCPTCAWEDKQIAEIAGTDEDMAHLYEPVAEGGQIGG